MSLDPAFASVIVAGIAALASIATTILTQQQSQKIGETHKQVTVNHHSSKEPTVLDRIDDVKQMQLEQGKTLNEMRGDFNAHVTHSNEMDQRLIKLEIAKTAEHEVRLTQVESEVRDQA